MKRRARPRPNIMKLLEYRNKKKILSFQIGKKKKIGAIQTDKNQNGDGTHTIC